MGWGGSHKFMGWLGLLCTRYSSNTKKKRKHAVKAHTYTHARTQARTDTAPSTCRQEAREIISRQGKAHIRDSRFSGLGLLCLRRDILCALPSPAQRGHVALRRCSVAAMITGEMDGQQIATQHTCDSVRGGRTGEGGMKGGDKDAARSRRTISAGRNDSTMERQKRTSRRREGCPGSSSVAWRDVTRNRDVWRQRRRTYEWRSTTPAMRRFRETRTRTPITFERDRCQRATKQTRRQTLPPTPHPRCCGVTAWARWWGG